MDGQQYNINPNVVLTADNGQYDAAMSASATYTDRAAASIDALAEKISRLTKTSGKISLGISAADVVTIGGATAAWASYEKQVSQLQAQSAILTRTQSAASSQMKVYTDSVRNLRSEFGSTTSEAAALTLTLSKMSDHTATVRGLTTEFTKMSRATGESSAGLASSVLNLQKVMGTPQRETKAYTDQLTTLAANANTSASALADFASQIAPIGRTIGMSQTDITGVSKAFISAGQDGYRAATAFNKIMSDIAYQTSTGSPGLAQYANLVGVTVDRFKAMSGADKAVAIFDSLNRMGPSAIVKLNQMGLDGTSMIKAITAMSQQSGGLGTAIQQARAAYNDGSAQRGSAAASDNMHDELQKLRQELEMTAESIGGVFGPAMTKVVSVMEKFASVASTIASGPVGKMVGLIAGAVAPLTAFGGGLLLAAGAITKLSGGAMLFRNSGMLGFREGFRGAQTIKPGLLDSEGRALTWAGSGTLRGNQIAEGGTRFQRYMFNTGVRASMGVQRGFSYLDNAFGSPGARLLPGEDESQRSGFLFRAGSPMSMTQEARQNMTRGQQISRAFGSALYAVPAGIRSLVIPQYDQARYANPADRHTYLGPGGSPVPASPEVVRAAQDVHRAGANVNEVKADPYATHADISAAEKEHQASLTRLADVEKIAATEAQALAAAQKAVGREFAGTGVALAELRAAAVETAGALAGAASGVARAGLTGAASLGKSIFSSVGGVAGLGFIGVPIAMSIADHFKDHSTAEFRDYSGAGSAYMKAGGVEVPGSFNNNYVQTVAKPTRTSARTATATDQLYAQSTTYTPFDKQIKGKSRDQVLAYLGPLWNQYQKNPQSVYGVKTDLLNAGFSQQDVTTMIGQLDTGDVPGLGVFASQVTNPARNNAGAAYFLNHALATASDTATAMNLSQGPGAAQASLGESTAQILSQGFGAAKGGVLSSQATGAFQKILSSRMFGGVDFSAGDLSKLFYDSTTSYARGSRTPYNTFTQADYVKQALSTGAKSPKDAAQFSTDFIGRMRGLVKSGDMSASEYGHAVKGFLTYQGVQDPDHYTNTKTSLDDIRSALMDVFTTAKHEAQSSYEALGAHISELGGAAKEFGASVARQDGAINKFLNNIENPVLKNRAINEQIRDQGAFTDPTGAITRTANIRSRIGSNDQPEAQIAAAVGAQAQQVLTWQQQFMTGPQAFKSQVGANMATVMASNTPATADERQQAKYGVIQNVVDQASLIKQQLMQQIQFNLQMSRAQQDFGLQMSYSEHDYQLQRSRAFTDFNLQRAYAEHDYNLSRSRAEEDYNISRTRNEYQFHLSMTRNLFDYNLQRKRQDQDYQHSTMLMIEQQAQAMYNIYDRVKVAQTDSATYLLVNSADQTRRMQEQEQNLGQLRGMGLSDNAIQQLGFTKSENAQQLSRFVGEVTNNPELITEFNQQIKERLKAAAKLTKDDSSTEWQEYQRQYKLQRDRAQSDFERSVKRARADFSLQMNQMEDDFRRSMSRQAQDYETAQARASKQFHMSMDRAATDYATNIERMRESFKLSMDRAQEDMDVMAKGVQGTIRQVMVQGAKELKGELGKQAQDSLNTFDALGKAFGMQGWDIMKMMAQIFGFKAPPKPNYPSHGGSLPGPGDGGAGSGGGGGQKGSPGHPGHADGGVLPGFTPGKDVHIFHSDTAGTIALSGGEAIMRPEWTRAMGGEKGVALQNELAKRGALHSGYAAGGVYRPMAIGTPGGIHDVSTGFPAVDMPVPEGTPVHSVASGRVTYSGDFKGPEPRNGSRQNGYYSYGRHIQIDHGAFSSLYAHLSQRIAALAQAVAGGQVIGLSGHTGYVQGTTGNHLHFGVNGGRSPLDFMHASTNYGGAGSFIGPFLGGGGGAGLKSLLKKTYPALEKQASQFMGGLIPQGHLSGMINDYARQAWDEASKQYGGMGGGSIPGAPTNVTGNKKIVQSLAAARGWVGNEWDALYQLVMSESSFNNNAQNPGSTAYGLFQFLDGTWGNYDKIHKTSDPRLQTIAGLDYVKGRYGDPIKAWAYHRAHGTYGDGSIFSGATNITVGERGEEIVLPLNNHGAQFMADTLKKYSTGTSAAAHGLRHAMPMAYGSGGQFNTYNIDRSTQFSGPITVQANNPNELVNQLQARQRVMALTNPVRGGARV